MNLIIAIMNIFGELNLRSHKGECVYECLECGDRTTNDCAQFCEECGVSKVNIQAPRN